MAGTAAEADRGRPSSAQESGTGAHLSILGLHHITVACADAGRTTEYYTDTLGFRQAGSGREEEQPLYFAAGNGSPESLISFIERPGQTQHYSLTVTDETALDDWRNRLLAAGLPASSIEDRVYFKSFFTQDPDGQTVELATRGPGFAQAPPAHRSGRSSEPLRALHFAPQ